ncbi:MAG: hypothetical protein ACLPYB_14740 [Desulfobaccales bacterium]
MPYLSFAQKDIRVVLYSRGLPLHDLSPWGADDFVVKLHDLDLPKAVVRRWLPS